MWGRRRNAAPRLPRQRALGRLESEWPLARSSKQAEGEPETVPYPPTPRAGQPGPRTCRPPAPACWAEDVPLGQQRRPRAAPRASTGSFPLPRTRTARATVRSAEIIIPYERESAASPHLITRFVGRLETGLRPQLYFSPQTHQG